MYIEYDVEDDRMIKDRDTFIYDNLHNYVDGWRDAGVSVSKSSPLWDRVIERYHDINDKL